MDISGQNAKLWITEHKKRDGGTWNDYSIGINKKKQDGSYTNMYLRVKFGRDVDVPENLPNGTKINYEGFMSIDEYEDRDGAPIKKFMGVLTKVDFIDFAEPADGYSYVEEPIPF